MSARGGWLAVAVLCGTAGCSTIELGFDVPCRLGAEPALLRVWVVPDWRWSYWGTYLLVGDLLLPVVDPFVSGYFAIDDLSNPLVRTRGGPWLAPVGKLAAIVLPCVSAHREPMDLERSLGSAYDLQPVRDLQLAAGATLAAAKARLVASYGVDDAEAARMAARIVEVEWVPAPGGRAKNRELRVESGPAGATQQTNAGPTGGRCDRGHGRHPHDSENLRCESSACTKPAPATRLACSPRPT